MKKKKLEQLEEYVNFTVGIIGLILISWGLVSLTGKDNFFVYGWIIIGILLIIFRIILWGKLK